MVREWIACKTLDAISNYLKPGVMTVKRNQREAQLSIDTWCYNCNTATSLTCLHLIHYSHSLNGPVADITVKICRPVESESRFIRCTKQSQAERAVILTSTSGLCSLMCPTGLDSYWKRRHHWSTTSRTKLREETQSTLFLQSKANHNLRQN